MIIQRMDLMKKNDRRLESRSWVHQTVAAVQESATPNVNQDFQSQQTAQTSGIFQPIYGNFRGNYSALKRGYNNLN